MSFLLFAGLVRFHSKANQEGTRNEEKCRRTDGGVDVRPGNGEQGKASAAGDDITAETVEQSGFRLDKLREVRGRGKNY